MKLLHYSLTALSLLSALAFTSCREWEDNNQSMALSGEWRGNFGMYYDYVDARGNVYTFDSYDTYLTFIPAYNGNVYPKMSSISTHRFSISSATPLPSMFTTLSRNIPEGRR